MENFAQLALIQLVILVNALCLATALMLGYRYGKLNQPEPKKELPDTGGFVDYQEARTANKLYKAKVPGKDSSSEMAL